MSSFDHDSRSMPPGTRMKTRSLVTTLAGLAAAVSLSGCAVPRIVDDGRTLDVPTVARVDAAHRGYAALARAALATEPLVKATRCSKAATSPVMALSLDKTARNDNQTAWLRHHGVDEKLRVIWADPSTGLKEHDVIAKVQGSASRGQELFKDFIVRNVDGKPLDLTIESGAVVALAPVEVCRGRLWPDDRPESGETLGLFHSFVPATVFQDEDLSDDEVLWMVVWQQGLSEEASGRLRTYAIGETVLLGGIGAVLGFSAGKAAALQAMGKVAITTTARVLVVTTARVAAIAAAKLAVEVVVLQSVAAPVHRWGMNAVAATAFEEADAWAVRAMLLLGRDPAAGMRLHARMMKDGLVRNPFAMEQARLDRMVATLKERVPQSVQVAEVQVIPAQDASRIETRMIAPGSDGPGASSPDEPATGSS